jgi:hypothetical protein
MHKVKYSNYQNQTQRSRPRIRKPRGTPPRAASALHRISRQRRAGQTLGVAEGRALDRELRARGQGRLALARIGALDRFVRQRTTNLAHTIHKPEPRIAHERSAPRRGVGPVVHDGAGYARRRQRVLRPEAGRAVDARGVEVVLGGGA